MTYRDLIRNKASGILFLGIVSWVCIAALILGDVQDSGLFIVICMAIFAFCSIYINWLIDCPKCMVSLGGDTLPICYPNIFIIRTCNNCQSCGFRFDNEIDGL
jgi:hypothetical protein